MNSHDAKQEFLNAVLAEYGAASTPNQPRALFMKKAFDHFLEMGLPDRKHPSYQYFPLTKLYENKAKSCVHKISKAQVLEKVLPECQNSYIVINDGILDLELSQIQDVPHGVIIDRLESTTSPYMPFVHAKLLHKQKKERDPFVLLCQSQINGLLLVIPEGVKCKKPLQIIFLSEGKKHVPVFNAYIHLAQKSSLEIMTTTLCTQNGCIASYVDVDAELESAFEMTRMNSDSSAMMLEAMTIHLKKEAKAKIIDLSQPLAPSKFHLHVLHEQKDADSEFHALALMDEKQEYHVTTHFEHICEETHSHQHVKTVLKSKSKASFEGKIHVHKEALLTQSYQKHATLLIGSSGIVYSRPNLKILADDVKASHGATIAELDKEALFYLKTRGVDEKTAKRLLLHAFCNEIIQMISSDAIKEAAYELVAKVQDYDTHDAILS